MWIWQMTWNLRPRVLYYGFVYKVVKAKCFIKKWDHTHVYIILYIYIYTYVYITYAISFCMCLIIGQAEYINLSIIYNVRLVCLRTLSSGWDVSSFTWSVRHVSYIYICLAILCTNAFSISFQSLNGLLMRTKHCSNLILKTSTMRKVVLWDHWN